MSEDRLIEKYLGLFGRHRRLVDELRTVMIPIRSLNEERALHGEFDDVEEAILSTEIELRLAKKFDAARIARKLAGL